MKLAVLVAIDYYGQRGIDEHDLPASISSSKLLRAMLQAQGFKVTTVWGNSATRAAFYAAVRAMFAQMRRPDDVGVIAWNGHAARIKWRPTPTTLADIEVLVTHDALSTYAPPNFALSIPPHFLKALLSERKQGRLFTSLDVCYGAAFRQGDKRPRNMKPQFTTGKLAGPFDVHPPAATAQAIGRPAKTMAVLQSLPGFVGMVPSQRSEESVQILDASGKWEALWTGCLYRAAKTSPPSYYAAFKLAKLEAERRWPLAHPQILGDMPTRMRPFLS